MVSFFIYGNALLKIDKIVAFIIIYNNNIYNLFPIHNFSGNDNYTKCLILFTKNYCH